MAYGCPTLKLFSGRAIPAVGLGTYAPRENEEDVIQAVKTAVRCGYRHIDCAAIYRNERAVGHALKELFVEGIIQREDIFVTSKLWNTCHQPDLVQPSLKKTLEDLGLKYLDLYLMHWPLGYKEGGDFLPVDENGKVLFSDVDYLETWGAMEDCVDLGLVKHIGCSNFNSKQLQRLLDEGRIQPAVNQFEVNCYLTNRKLIEYCKSKNILPVAYGPLGTPGKNGSVNLLKDSVLVQIGQKYNKSSAQVALRFLIQQDIAVIPKSVTPARIEENFQVYDFKLTEEEMAQLFSLNRNFRNYREEIALDHKYYPFYEDF
ncbi:1,5-anhydro-D-fructose reductase-like [Pomacea canaliculata]|uniref:1,5-anhydro-D-fructose reductase-like n=1 Tax=Pomacea canaliculata TaxID=400727 RepID=UPI000D72F289|nr:1,5-anhydro-D-fructose reductase-like [Pomacea canaliculata]XP_025085899.1 1,5-anhydro-D-fructose reductase-like [Pomacea canaliculata]XP_025085900.1 1,5-anhydro-D-fructose reductase-like [Pomacea canaliculata]